MVSSTAQEHVREKVTHSNLKKFAFISSVLLFRGVLRVQFYTNRNCKTKPNNRSNITPYACTVSYSVKRYVLKLYLNKVILIVCVYHQGV